ncbi:MAG: tetratricopeptide repeat protein [Polyangiaceae bacterium]|jgi:Tfp pilus assembly protein PilF
MFFALAFAACNGKSSSVPNTSPERQSEAEYDVARDYFYRGDPRRALDHCRRAVELDEENAKALYFASTIHLFFCSGKLALLDPDCRLADAETYVRRALKVDDRFREARNTLGQILILEKKYLEAIAVLGPLTKDPAFESSFLAWGNLGWAQVLAGQLDAGIASLKNSIAEPRFCVGHYRLGVAYQRQGDWPAAEQSFTNALSVDSPDCKTMQDAWAERGRTRARLGKVGEARADFTRCRDLYVDSPEGKACGDDLARLPR